MSEPTIEQPFSYKYAEIYDVLHEGKPYRAEADFVINLGKTYLKRQPKSLIDLACGTGRHLVELAKNEIQIQGNDLSEGMLHRAQERLDEHFIKNCTLTRSPMQSVQPAKGFGKFDIASAYYTAVGYLVEPQELDLFFRNLKFILAPDGLFFADFWHGPQMSVGFSASRTREAHSSVLDVKRTSFTSHVPEKNALAVNFEFDVKRKGADSKEILKESHIVRYHSLPEIESILLAHGFKLLESGPFFDEATDLSKAWNFYICAQKI